MTIASHLSFSDPELHRGVAEAMAAAALTPAGAADPAEIARHQALAQDLGWLAARIPEAEGGLELGLDFAADLCLEVGRHLITGPLRETLVLLPALAAELPELRPLLAGVLAGEIRLALAEPAGAGAGGEGAGDLVPWLRQASHVLWLEDDGAGGMQGRLCPVAALQAADLQSLDPTAGLCRVTAVPPGAAVGFVLAAEAAARVRAALDIATAAEHLGLAEAALARSLAHLGERRQFGVAIGSFQALKHRLADVQIAQSAARLAIAAAVAPGALPQAAALARILAADAAATATASGLQLLGGLGFSWENDMHLYLKRARRLACGQGGVEIRRQAAGEAVIAAALAEAD